MSAGTLPPVLEAGLKVSVELNGLFMPFARALKSLERFCRPLLVHNNDSTFEASVLGSSFLIRYRERNLMLFAKHQLGQPPRSPSDAMLAIFGGKSKPSGLGPSGSGMITFDPDYKVYEDICVLEFSPTEDSGEIDPLFCKLLPSQYVPIASLKPESIVSIFAIGYPSSQTAINYEEIDGELRNLDIACRRSVVYLERTEPSAWDIEHRLPLQLLARNDNEMPEPDGLSGAPVFVVYQDVASQCHIGFGGFVTEASKAGRFMVYSAHQIFPVVERFVATPYKSVA